MYGINKKKVLSGLGALVLACGSVTAFAQQGDEGGVSLHYGIGNHYQRVTLNYETPSWWSHQFSNGWGRLDLSGEFGAAYWWANGSREPGHVWQANAIPMFRWWANDRFYIEAGIGATAFSHTSFADKRIGSAFQFGDHIGMGFLLTKNNRIGVRYSHFSNAGIKRPNPGLDVVQMTYTYQF
ncbi:acyloxyacyl hydrolase [Bordetella trematum]|uniref:acyloxyacyl hydrolase n=1 Tax=Bordetella trematum TaxID=123899 RepID=UPI001558FBA3|nr:acyloxyacyl hydrolase [Bordetella trematum]